jgi:hypothetical protein
MPLPHTACALRLAVCISVLITIASLDDTLPKAHLAGRTVNYLPLSVGPPIASLIRSFDIFLEVTTRTSLHLVAILTDWRTLPGLLHLQSNKSRHRRFGQVHDR